MSQCILIVDDDCQMVALGRLILERYGYQVLAAYDGTEALAIMRQENGAIGVLLLDLMLGTKDGWQVLNEIKADARLSHIPVIILTARPQLPAEVAPHIGHFAHYVTKPFEVHDLLAKINEVLCR